MPRFGVKLGLCINTHVRQLHAVAVVNCRRYFFFRVLVGCKIDSGGTFIASSYEHFLRAMKSIYSTCSLPTHVCTCTFGIHVF